RRLLSPVTDADLTWHAWCAQHPEHAQWCASRWLAAWPALQPIADGDAYWRTLDSWHALAEHVVCTARHRVNGKIGLRWVAGGFATPFFGAGEQVRVGVDAIAHVRGDERTAPFTTIGAAADFVGVEPGVPAGLFAPSTDGRRDRVLDVDAIAAAR